MSSNLITKTGILFDLSKYQKSKNYLIYSHSAAKNGSKYSSF